MTDQYSAEILCDTWAIACASGNHQAARKSFNKLVKMKGVLGIKVVLPMFEQANRDALLYAAERGHDAAFVVSTQCQALQ